MVYLYSLGHFCKCLAPLEIQSKGKASEGFFFFLCSGVWVDGGDIYLLQFIKCIVDKHAKERTRFVWFCLFLEHLNTREEGKCVDW